MLGLTVLAGRLPLLRASAQDRPTDLSEEIRKFVAAFEEGLGCGSQELIDGVEGLVGVR